MKKALAFLVIVFTVSVVQLWPTKASCAYCYSGRCINSSICGNNCKCLKKGNDHWGACYSMN